MTTVQGPARDLCTAVKFTALQHIRLRVVGGGAPQPSPFFAALYMILNLFLNEINVLGMSHNP